MLLNLYVVYVVCSGCNTLWSNQVNGVPLIGQTHKEVVNVLKELPMHVCLVCSHVSPPPLPDSDEDEDAVRLTLKELLAEFNEKVKARGRGPHRGVDRQKGAPFAPSRL